MHLVFFGHMRPVWLSFITQPQMCSSVESKDFYNLWKLSWTNKKILTEAETWMVLGQKRLAVTRHAAVADASLLSLWFALPIHLTSHLLPVHTPQNITHNLHTGEKHTRNWGWGVYLLAQDPASPSLSKPIQFPAQIGVIYALGNPPRVTFEEKTKKKNWTQSCIWNKSIFVYIICAKHDPRVYFDKKTQLRLGEQDVYFLWKPAKE